MEFTGKNMADLGQDFNSRFGNLFRGWMDQYMGKNGDKTVTK
jgi:hypothetical protein